MLRLFPPSSPYFRRPQMTHGTVSGDFSSSWHPSRGRATRYCLWLCIPWEQGWVTVPRFGSKPTDPSNTTENGLGAVREHGERPCSALALVTTQTHWLLLTIVFIHNRYLLSMYPYKVFQGAIHGVFLCLFASGFQLILKITTMPLQHTHFLEAFALWLRQCGCVTFHRTKLYVSHPPISRNRSEQPNARKGIMKLFCHICTGRLKAVKWLSSWKWVPEQGEDWKQLGRHHQSWTLLKLADWLLSLSFLYMLSATWPEINAGKP